MLTLIHFKYEVHAFLISPSYKPLQTQFSVVRIDLFLEKENTDFHNYVEPLHPLTVMKGLCFYSTNYV